MSLDVTSLEIGKNRIEALSDGTFALVMTGASRSNLPPIEYLSNRFARGGC